MYKKYSYFSVGTNLENITNEKKVWAVMQEELGDFDSWNNRNRMESISIDCNVMYLSSSNDIFD